MVKIMEDVTIYQNSFLGGMVSEINQPHVLGENLIHSRELLNFIITNNGKLSKRKGVLFATTNDNIVKDENNYESNKDNLYKYDMTDKEVVYSEIIYVDYNTVSFRLYFDIDDYEVFSFNFTSNGNFVPASVVGSSAQIELELMNASN